jgi:SAM-dependent methyltransferase
MARMSRRGESERYQIISAWLPDCDGLSILDVGCGDGQFLSQVLSGRGRPAQLRLEDIVEKWADLSLERLRDAADKVSAHVLDSRSGQDSAQYDLVLALGVTDYDHDWRGMIADLVARSRGLLFVDVPKVGPFHNVARALWLRYHGLRLQTASRTDITRLVGGAKATVVELPLQWVIRYDVGIMRRSK